MNKKHNIIIIGLVLLITSFNMKTAYAFGKGNTDNQKSEYELDGNNAQVGGSTNSGGGSTKPKPQKPKPPVTEAWYDKISWDKQNDSTSWIDEDNRLVIFYNQSTKSRESSVSKDWHWVFKYGQQEGNANEILGERFDKQQILFVAPKTGYYLITSTPRVTVSTYYYSRLMTYKYWLKEDTDGSFMVAKFISKEGEVPTKNIISVKDVEQTHLTKTFSIFLSEGQKFDPSPTTKIESKTENIDTTSILSK